LKKNTESPEKARPSHYVGIGASAGGLEAIEKFITNMPSQNSLAFIIVQHLSPDYKSLMVELLTKKTKMPVHRAEEGMEVCAGNIYLIPPKKNLTIFHGKLLLKDKSPQEGINLPIDIFLQSLAEDQAEKAIAIILSGTGSDGARGVRAIKENNGMVMVQDESSAKFDGMPRAAISTGTADYILAPEKMPDQLLSYVAHPYISGKRLSAALLDDVDSLTRLFAAVRAKTKADFTHYKPSTISRRIERRMTVNQISDFDEYVRYLSNFPGEVMALYREMLIGVTSFFRDKEAMEELRTKILPSLLKRVKDREIRCWIAGCSTGEEPYTLAIMFKEVMEEYKINHDVKIFATDIDREAIIKAGSGIYPESIAADLPQTLLSKYFYHKGDSFHITRMIREMVVFAQHNLVNDPPFTNIDLISCRNLLIYLQPVLQSKALAMFNFSLNSHGILFLGKSETTGEMSDYFKPLHQQFRIYQSRGRHYPTPGNLQISRKESGGSGEPAFVVRRANRREGDRESNIIKAFLNLVSERYVPLSVIVDEHLDIQQIQGDTSGYFRIPSGPVAYNISKLAVRELAIPLATGIQKVFRTGEEVTYSNIHLKIGPHNKNIRLYIRPLLLDKGMENMVVVFLEEMKTAAISATKSETVYDVDKETRQRIDDLEQELQFARENLQATIEELETSNEELQATNEELLSSNEELQSTNEELQSTNEELYTVNAEHQNKIIELTELTNDVDNLLTSSRIGTLIVDENLEIRKYSPEITHVFNILEKDIGRPFSHISHLFQDFDPVATVQKVQETNKSVEKEVQTRDGKNYLARILPYHIGPRVYSGVVLTFVDITELSLVRHTLASSDTTAQHIKENIPAGLLVYQKAGKDNLLLVDCNTEAEKLTGISMKKHGEKTLLQTWPEAAEVEALRKFINNGKNGTVCVLDDVPFTEGSFKAIFHVHAFRLPENKIAISFEDHTQKFQYKKRLQRSSTRFPKLLESTGLLWWEWHIPEDTAVPSGPLTQLVGCDSRQKWDNVDFWSNSIHPEDLDRVLFQRKKFIHEADNQYTVSYRLREGKEKYIDMEERGEISGWDEQAWPTRFIGVLSPVTPPQKSEGNN
jgi:two-component system, chemotaxis family, CheB/CheR fusion protein